MQSLHAIADASAALVALDPTRSQILHLLQEPDSATGVARRLKLPRQKVNYHLRELEKHGLVTLVEERRKGNCIERIVRASATAYVLSPDALGQLAADPSRIADRFSSAYLMATAGAAIRELAWLQSAADKTGKRLPTLTLDAEVRFRSAEERGKFAAELTHMLARLVSKYHDEHAAGGRRYKLIVGAYPSTRAGQARESKHKEGL